jgi:hypothetical protein
LLILDNSVKLCGALVFILDFNEHEMCLERHQFRVKT